LTIGDRVFYTGTSGETVGRVCAIETYTDDNGTRKWVWVRWINGDDCPSKDTERFAPQELEEVNNDNR
jgi:hypothetical protein